MTVTELSFLYDYELVRDDIDVNEHKRLLIQFYTQTQIKIKEQHLYCCSTFHSHIRIFINEREMSPRLQWRGIFLNMAGHKTFFFFSFGLFSYYIYIL